MSDEVVDARTALWTQLRDRPTASLRPPSLVCSRPLRPLPGALFAKLDVRGRMGLTPVAGADHPRRERLQTTAVLPATVATLLAVVTIVALATGHDLIGLIALFVTAAAGTTAVAGYRWVQADPLRITREEQRALDAAGSWQSRQQWTGALLSTPERALVDVAIETARAIAEDPAWTSGYLDGHRLALDLALELDAVDAQAMQLAQAHISGPAAAAARDACLDRVLALQRYRTGLVELTGHITRADAIAHGAPAIGELTAGTQQDAFAVDGLDRLTAELGTLARAIDTTTAETRPDQS